MFTLGSLARRRSGSTDGTSGSRRSRRVGRARRRAAGWVAAVAVSLLAGSAITSAGTVTAQAATPDQLLDHCPIDGPGTFEDSWGWARSGGRSHEGVDIIAARGVPVIAVRDGHAHFKTNRLGGRAIWLTAPDGDKFYYAHLSDWHGESRDVAAGDVIGYVGSTGNAGGAHLHFETLPGGRVENPYPHTLRACVPPPAPVVNEVAQANSSDDLAHDPVPDLVR